MCADNPSIMVVLSPPIFKPPAKNVGVLFFSQTKFTLLDWCLPLGDLLKYFNDRRETLVFYIKLLAGALCAAQRPVGSQRPRGCDKPARRLAGLKILFKIPPLYLVVSH